MKPRIARIGLHALLVLGLAACSTENRTRPPRTQVSFIHAAQSFGPLNVLRVQRVETGQTGLAYQSSRTFTWDTDTYTFNIEALRPASAPEPVHSFTATLTPGNNYLVVLGEEGGAMRELVIETESDPPGGSEAGVLPVHTANSLGSVDFYLEAPGTDPANAMPRGTLGFGGNLAPFTVSPGDYQVTLTEAGNPAGVLLATQTFPLSGGIETVLTVLDEANVALAPLGLLISSGDAAAVTVDENLQAGFRALNAITSGDGLDVTVDGEFSPPLLPAVPAGVPTAYAFIDAGDHDLTVSPEANPGVIEIDQAFTTQNGVLGTWFFTGSPGELAATFTVEDGRIIADQARLTLFNGVVAVTPLDVFAVSPGTALETVAPATLANGVILADIPFELGEYEITVRESDTSSVLAGPLTVTLPAEGNYGILLTDAAGGGVDVTLLDDFN